MAGVSETIVPYTAASAESVPPPSGPPAGPSAFSKLLHKLGSELDSGEALADRAIHAGTAGAHLSPESLLTLQAGIYRYSEAIDLVTKLVDRATQAVKTTLQNQ